MTTVKENYALKDLAGELDTDITSIIGKVITLNDLKTVIAHLRIKMDGIDERESRIHFMELHRSIRLIDDLFRYTVNELKKDVNEAEKTSEVLFKKIIKEG